MKIRDIDLKHFNIVLKKKRVGFTLGTISIKSEPNFTSLYSGVRLNYEFGTELVFEKIGINQEIKIADLTDKQQISIKQSIVAKLNRAIKLQKKSASKTPVKVITNKDEFDFSEFDELDNEPIPMLTDFVNKEVVAETNGKIDDFDDFDFSELDINDTGVTKEVVETADFDFDDDVVTSDFEEILEKDTPAKSRSIDEMLTSLVDSRQQLNVSNQTISKLLDEIKIVEDNHKLIESTVDDLERELFNALQKKHQ